MDAPIPSACTGSWWRWLCTCVVALAVIRSPLTSAPAADSVERVCSPEACVLSVNGEPVTAREFVEALRRHRFRGADPAALRRAALDEVIRFKVVLQLARAQGVVAEIGDAALREAHRRENERRARTAAAGGPVFGPRSLTWAHFRSYWLDGVERELMRVLAEKAGPPSEEQLRGFYREHPALFTAPKRTAPEPFEDLRGHVADTYRKHHYATAVRTAVTSARVEEQAALLDALRPELVLPGEAAPAALGQ